MTEELKDAGYYLDHPDEVTPEIMAQLTGEEIKNEEKQVEVIPVEVKAEETTEEKPEILARDGKHTIPYSELETSREEAKKAREEVDLLLARVTSLEAERAELQEKREAKAEAGKDTSEIDAQLAEFDSEYPNISKIQDIKIRRELAKSEARIEELTNQVKELAESVKPLGDKTAKNEWDIHNGIIRAIHSDYDPEATGKALVEYAESLPFKKGMEAMRVINEGTAPEIIGLISEYKESSKKPEPKPEQKKEIKEPEDEIPRSLSDFPAGGQVATNEVESFLAMNQLQQIDFASKYPEKYNRIMSSII